MEMQGSGVRTRPPASFVVFQPGREHKSAPITAFSILLLTGCGMRVAISYPGVPAGRSSPVGSKVLPPCTIPAMLTSESKTLLDTGIQLT
jgi:hypothetical protein